MAAGTLTIERIVPSPHVLRLRLQRFAELPDATITAFSDSALRFAKDAVGEDAWIEFEPFPTLIRRFLTLTGAESPPIPSSRLRETAIARALQALPADNLFAGGRSFAGSHQALAQTLEELHSHGLNGEALRCIAETAASQRPALARKLSDLADIEHLAAKTLGELGFGSELRLIQTCRQAVPDFDATPAPLLVVAGDRYPPMRVEWLQWLRDQGVDVTVVAYRHSSRAKFFAEADALVDQLKQTGGQLVDVGSGSTVADRLFGDSSAAAPRPADVIILAEADDLSESEYALRQAREDRAETVIFARRPGYVPLLEAASRRLGVPIAFLRRDPLLTNCLAAHTLRLIQALADDDIRNFGAIVAQSRSDGGTLVERQQRLAIAREATRHTDPWGHFAAEIRVRDLESERWMLGVLDWRQQVEGFIPARDWLDHYQILRELLPWRNLDDPEIIARDAAAAVVMEQCLAMQASVTSLSPDANFDLVEFAAICRQIWEGADYSVERHADDAVRVVTDLDLLPAARTVIALGLHEGSFPRRPSADAVLSDQDRRHLAELAPEFVALETTREKATRERTDFYRLATATGNRLIASYPRQSDGRACFPAIFLDRLADAAGIAFSPESEHHPLAPVDSMLAADQRLRAALEGSRHIPPAPEISPATAEQLTKRSGQPVRYQSVYWADTCPFRFVMSERTPLRPRGSRLRWRRLAQVPQAARIAAVSADELEPRLKEALDSTVSDWSPATLDWELRTLEQSRESLTAGWADRERASRNRWRRFNTRTNVAFEGFNTVLQRKVPGLSLEGTVPAVSESDRRTIVHLYEVGRKPDVHRVLSAWWRYALLWAAFDQNDRAAAIEVDFTNDVRVIFTVGSDADDGVARAKTGEVSPQRLDSNPVDDTNPRQEVWEKIWGMLRRSQVSIRSGRATPEPGEYCEGCNYGELCRRHRDFGDLDDPFQGGGMA